MVRGAVACRAKVKVRQECIVEVMACKGYYLELAAEFHWQPVQFT